MKMERPHYRRMALARFVKPGAADQLNLGRGVSPTGERRVRTRKMFVIKQTIRLQPKTGTHKKIRRVLIFDNHPDSLRLIFGRRHLPGLDLSRRHRVSW